MAASSHEAPAALHNIATARLGSAHTAPPASSGVLDYRGTLEHKPDAARRPMWVCPDGRIVLEADSAVHKEATDFLVAIAEPVCRTRYMQECQLTSTHA